MPTYETLLLDGVPFRTQSRGQGPALVLVHAGIADLRMWDDQMEVFPRHFQTIRYDVRGWGRTPCPPGRFADHDDLRELLDQLGVARAHVLGCSNGGRIALDFSLAYPERVDKLVLVGSGLGGHEFTDPATDRQEAEIRAAYGQGDKAGAAELELRLWVDGLYRTPAQVDPAVRSRAAAMIAELYELPEDEGERTPLQPPASGRLPEVQAPTLVVVGDQDTPDILRIADLLKAFIPGARQIVMPDVAHLPNMEKPSEFNRLVLSFLLDS